MPLMRYTPHMAVRFYIDADTGLPHILRHNVDEDEVEAVLKSPVEDYAGKEGARVSVGQTESGRYLKVIYVPEPQGMFVITAYELKGKPLAAFRRRQKGRRA
ncbi:hypothetical protein BH24DEI1_BH24DEI1_11010 [soil metagenome]